ASNCTHRQNNTQHQQKLINQNQLHVERLARLRQRLEELRSKQAKVSEQDRPSHAGVGRVDWLLHVERLARLRQRLEELRSKQAKVSEQDRLIQEEIVSMSELLDVAPEHTHQPEPPNAIPHDRQSMFEFRENESTDRARADIVERTPFGPT